MIENSTVTPMYYFLMEFAKLVYAAFPIFVIILGASFIVQSVHSEPWGNTIYGLGIVTGIALIFLGILLVVVL